MTHPVKSCFRPHLLLFCLASLLVARLGQAADFATEMLEATHKFFHTNSTATCFFVQREKPDESLYLVTAAHVLERTTGDTGVVVLRERVKDEPDRRHDFTVTIRHEGKPLWTRHATEDVAVLRLTEAPPMPVSPIPLAALAEEPQLAAFGLHICSPVFVLTYPHRFEGNRAGGFAVARQGIVASHPFLPVERQKTFLADFTTFSGDSGGPVFVPGNDNHPMVVGIVLSQYRHDEKVTTEDDERTIHHPLGLATVLHAHYLRATIEQAAKPLTETP